MNGDPALEGLIYNINDAGWTIHSLSQYRSFGKLVWSATVRLDGPGRQPISRGQGTSITQAVLMAYGGINNAELEPKTTVHTKVKDPPITLANLLPTRPALVIRRR